MKIKDKEFEIFISEDEINFRIKQIADKINEDYAGKELLIIPVLNGAVLFASELMKKITIPCQFSFVKISTYFKTESTGNFNQLFGITEDIKDKHLLIIEDIVDTGFTMGNLITNLKEQQPASIGICTLLLKKKASNSSIKVNYTGFEIEDKFVVGYGLDYDGYGRNLSAIYVLKS